MNNKVVKFQLDTSSDVRLINEQTWKKIGRLSQLKTEKIAHGITGNKPKFLDECYINVTFMAKTLKLKRIRYESNPEPLRHGLVWLYCTSTIVGYLMPNPFLYI